MLPFTELCNKHLIVVTNPVVSQPQTQNRIPKTVILRTDLTIFRFRTFSDQSQSVAPRYDSAQVGRDGKTNRYEGFKLR